MLNLMRISSAELNNFKNFLKLFYSSAKQDKNLLLKFLNTFTYDDDEYFQNFKVYFLKSKAEFHKTIESKVMKKLIFDNLRDDQTFYKLGLFKEISLLQEEGKFNFFDYFMKMKDLIAPLVLKKWDEYLLEYYLNAMDLKSHEWAKSASTRQLESCFDFEGEDWDILSNFKSQNHQIKNERNSKVIEKIIQILKN
jgi:hypothetical protein